MKRIIGVGLAAALATFALAILYGYTPRSAAQDSRDDPRNTGKAPGGCYMCGSLDYVWVENADWFGILAEDACLKEKLPAYIASNPPLAKGKLCESIKTEMVKNGNTFRSFTESCPSFAALCGSDSDRKRACGEEDLPPWFDTGDCEAKGSDAVRTVNPHARAAVFDGRLVCEVSYGICGLPAGPRITTTFEGEPYSSMDESEAEKFCALKGYGKDNVPNRAICCAKFKKAYLAWTDFRRTKGARAPGEPCNPVDDADCDGTKNSEDKTPLGNCAVEPIASSRR